MSTKLHTTETGPGSKPSPLMTTDELMAELKVPKSTLYAWRATGKGPRGIRVGKHLRYRPADVEEWLERQADPNPAA